MIFHGDTEWNICRAESNRALSAPNSELESPIARKKGIWHIFALVFYFFLLPPFFFFPLEDLGTIATST